MHLMKSNLLISKGFPEELVKKFDSWLSFRKERTGERLNAMEFARHAEVSQDEAIGIFANAVAVKIMKFQFVLTCPNCNSRVQSHESLQHFRSEYLCETCSGEAVMVNSDDLQVYFELLDRPYHPDKQPA